MEKIKIGKYNAIIRFNNDNDSPNHSVQFHSINDAYNSIINWF